MAEQSENRVYIIIMFEIWLFPSNHKEFSFKAYKKEQYKHIWLQSFKSLS